MQQRRKAAVSWWERRDWPNRLKLFQMHELEVPLAAQAMMRRKTGAKKLFGKCRFRSLIRLTISQDMALSSTAAPACLETAFSSNT